MPIETIRAQVEHAARANWWKHRRSALLDQVVFLGKPQEPEAAARSLLFIEQYVRFSPDLLESVTAAAEDAGVREDLEPLLDAIVGYWELEEDLLPDHLGLVGLADDAYLTLRLIECFSRDHEEHVGQPLLAIIDLSQANRTMAQLLGDELTAQLESWIEQTMQRAELRVALQSMTRWRGFLEVGPKVPELPEQPHEKLVAEAAELPEPVKLETEWTRGQIIRGNVSLLALGLGVLLFFLWQRYFQFPATAEFRLFGWEGIKLGWLVSLKNLILGTLGLSALVTTGNLKNLIARFYWPFEQLKGDENKRFFQATGTVIVSALVLALFVVVCVSNVTAQIRSRPATLELIARVPEGPDAFFVISGDEDDPVPTVAHEVRLGQEPTRLVLRGLNAHAVLILRDKYNLRTVDALLLERRFWGVEVTDLKVEVPIPEFLSPAEKKLLTPLANGRTATNLKSSRWSLSLQGRPRLAGRLPNIITGASGDQYGPRDNQHLFLSPAEGTNCPARAPEDEEEIQSFWDEICKERRQVAQWRRQSPFYENDAKGSVLQDLPKHQVEILFVEGRILQGNGAELASTREAIRLEGTDQSQLKTRAVEEAGETRNAMTQNEEAL